MGDLGEMGELVDLGNLVILVILLEMSANLKLVVLKSVDLSVVDWWMSENWGNVCEFRVECEVNDERMRVECETNEERMMCG